jgi:membrane protein DedA with SNARE-associated domain
MNLQEFLNQYGYWAVFLGSIIEGESIILTASALASLGQMSIIKVALVTFWGTLIADQAIYFAGYFYGEKSLDYLQNRFPKIRPHVQKGLAFLKRHQTTYIMSFRFIYGIRIISPFIIGSQKIPFRRFSYLNFVAAVIWTILSCAAGYFLGTLIGRFTHHIGLVVLGVIGGVMLLGWILRRVRAEKL